MGPDNSANHNYEGKSVSVFELNFSYSTLYESGPEVLKNCTLQLEPGSRCLLLGSNGAGKTTMLNLLGGKNIHRLGSIMVSGQPAFHNTHPGISSITGNWTVTKAYGAWEVPYTKDISVEDLLKQSDQANGDPKRIEELIKVLDIDMQWRMHIVSDGQRRRVQIMMGLIKPFEVLLLDEVTVDLDVVARADLLNYLDKETRERGATIVYATHIFDGLERWATHITHLCKGEVVKHGAVEDYDDFKALMDQKAKSALLKCVTAWLRAEKKQEVAERNMEIDTEVDLKLSKYQQGVPFAHNRMHNQTCC